MEHVHFKRKRPKEEVVDEKKSRVEFERDFLDKNLLLVPKARKKLTTPN
jgi:hypothetical protein